MSYGTCDDCAASTSGRCWKHRTVMSVSSPPTGAATRKTVRDFSQPCKHGYRVWHLVEDMDTTDGGNVVYPRMCPGGAEMTLTKVTAVWDGDMAVIRVDPGGEYWIDLETADG